MSDIHVHIVEGQETVYPEERIAELLREGTLTPDTYYWRPGMPQWRPLSTFKPATQAIVPARRTDALPEVAERRVRTEPEQPVLSERTSRNLRSSRKYRFRRRPELLTHMVQALLVLAFLVTCGELVLALPDLHPNTMPPGAGEASRTHLRHVLGWTGLGLDLVLLIFYCAWIYRANLNCHGFSSIVRFKGSWAVGCHFVPVMNLIRPYQVVQEIWKVSANPRSWQNDTPSGVVALWWTFWLLTLGLAEASFLVKDMAHTDVARINAAYVFLTLKVVQAVWLGLFFTLITLILRNQLKLTKPVSRDEKKPALGR